MVWDESLRRRLLESFTGKVLFDEPAAIHASIRAGGKIDAVIFPENQNQLSTVLRFLRSNNEPYLPVGNWTNLLVRDGGFRGAFISLSPFRELRDVFQGEKEAVIFAGAGCSLAELVKKAREESLSGMEFCAGIPGSVGGAIRMNAGAFGGEIKDVIEQIVIIDSSGVLKTFSHEQLNFKYRNLVLPPHTVITGGSFRLKRGDRVRIEDRINKIINERAKKHPLEFPNAGSIFKNPVDCPAGQLIEKLGLKGITIGDAQVSEKHGNFIVNRKEATASEILSLIEMIKLTVLQKTGRTLETEVKVVGEE
jgi:UDP-N-acetylmuramate dehydrogenase